MRLAGSSAADTGSPARERGDESSG